jgi:hypothetical protein
MVDEPPVLAKLTVLREQQKVPFFKNNEYIFQK